MAFLTEEFSHILTLRKVQKYDRLKNVEQKGGSAAAIVKMLAESPDQVEVLFERPTIQAWGFALDVDME